MLLDAMIYAITTLNVRTHSNIWTAWLLALYWYTSVPVKVQSTTRVLQTRVFIPHKKLWLWNVFFKFDLIRSPTLNHLNMKIAFVTYRLQFFHVAFDDCDYRPPRDTFIHTHMRTIFIFKQSLIIHHYSIIILLYCIISHWVTIITVNYLRHDVLFYFSLYVCGS
jgi:hypothetical protein